jgi:hypothetical protein
LPAHLPHAGARTHHPGAFPPPDIAHGNGSKKLFDQFDFFAKKIYTGKYVQPQQSIK